MSDVVTGIGQFRLHDVVRLRSGGPYMTLVGLWRDSNDVAWSECTWFNRDGAGIWEKKSGYFVVDVLERIR